MNTHIIIASRNSEKARLLKQFLTDLFQGQGRISTLFDKTIAKEYEIVETLMRNLASCSDISPLELAKKKAVMTATCLNAYAISEETLLTIPRIENDDEAFASKLKAHSSLSRSSQTSDQSYVTPTQDTLLSDPQKINPLIPFGFYKEHSSIVESSKFILEALSTFDDPLDRAATISSFFAFSSPNGIHTGTAVSRMEGYVAEQERGRRTFEYGSLFIKHEYSKTLSELPESVLMRISHRRKGIERLYHILKQSDAVQKKSRHCAVSPLTNA